MQGQYMQKESVHCITAGSVCRRGEQRVLQSAEDTAGGKCVQERSMEGMAVAGEGYDSEQYVQ